MKYFNLSAGRNYPFEFVVDGKVHEYLPGGWLSVNYTESFVVAAMQGCGLIQLPRYRVESELRDRRLVEALADWPSPTKPLNALYPHRRHLSPRVHIFLDWISEIFKDKFGPIQ